jgi:hypothetical protein
VRCDGVWWHTDETHVFAALLFFQRVALEQGNVGRTEYEYDAHALEFPAQTDAVGNRVAADIDYHLPAQMAPIRNLVALAGKEYFDQRWRSDIDNA